MPMVLLYCHGIYIGLTDTIISELRPYIADAKLQHLPTWSQRQSRELPETSRACSRDVCRPARERVESARGARVQLVFVALGAAAHAADALRGNGSRDWAFMQSVPSLGTMFHLRPWPSAPSRGLKQPRET